MLAKLLPHSPWRSRAILMLAGAVCLLHTSCFTTREITPRPNSWAQPVAHEDLPNLHRVSSKLYRSAQPAPEGYAAARESGIRTVVNLRPGEPGLKQNDEGVVVVQIPVKTHAPTYEQARRFFAVVDDPARQPVLLHCYHGADRTGAFTALYRINRQGWTADQAIAEMQGGDYGFHAIWVNLDDWVREAPAF